MVEAGGADALTMDALAERTGLSRATLYRRLGSRRALAERLVAERGLPAGLAGAGGEALRRRMLAAVRRLLGAEGVRGVTFERVAEEAGVGVATVYRHFGDRAGLVRAFAEDYGPRRAAWRIEREPGEDLRADLVGLATAQIRFIQANRDLVGLRFSRDPEAQMFFEAARDTPERASIAMRRYFQAQIEAGRLPARDPQLLAMAFAGLVLGCALAQPLGWEALEEDPERAAELLVEQFLDGAMGRREAT